MNKALGFLFIGFCLGLAVFDWAIAAELFIVVGVGLFVFYAVFDFFGWLFRPRVQQHTHFHIERHPDPTRPDEEISPMVFISNGHSAKRNGK